MKNISDEKKLNSMIRHIAKLFWLKLKVIFGIMDKTERIIAARDRLSSRQHLKLISHKGDCVYVEKGFKVYNGYNNIFLGSRVYLVDSLINAGDNLGSVTIDDFVFFGSGVKILARGHDYHFLNRDRQKTVTEKPIHIKKGAWIGSGAIILGGVTIGEHSVIGAGSIVTKDVPSYAIAAGNPAKVINCFKSSLAS